MEENVMNSAVMDNANMTEDSGPVEDVGECENMAETGSGCCYPKFGGHRRGEITHERRLVLYALAKKIAGTVLDKTERNERCLLRRMVENLLPGVD